jgi:hypothetical protein
MSTLIRLFATNSKQADSNGLRQIVLRSRSKKRLNRDWVRQQEDFATR